MQYIIMLVSFIGIICLSSVKELATKPLYWTPPVFLKHFSLGYRDFLADLLWLRLIQSADFCSFEKGRPVYKGQTQQCDLGWSYRVADLITDFSPRFKEPYLFSTVMLSVFTGDKKGAENILQKGLKIFPTDWRLNFYSAYFYSFEVKKPKKSAFYARMSADHGGPQWLYGFSNKTETKALQVREAIRQNLLKRNLTEEQKQYIQKGWSSRRVLPSGRVPSSRRVPLGGRRGF